MSHAKENGRPGQSVEDNPIPAGSAVRSRGAATPGQETREGLAAGNVATSQLAPGGAPQRAPRPSSPCGEDHDAIARAAAKKERTELVMLLGREVRDLQTNDEDHQALAPGLLRAVLVIVERAKTEVGR